MSKQHNYQVIVVYNDTEVKPWYSSMCDGPTGRALFAMYARDTRNQASYLTKHGVVVAVALPNSNLTNAYIGSYIGGEKA